MAARSPLPSSQASQVILPSTPPPTTTNQRQYDSTNGRITILTVKQIQLLLRALQLASRPVRYAHVTVSNRPGIVLSSTNVAGLACSWLARVSGWHPLPLRSHDEQWGRCSLL
eukprot:1160733-Pelagomonas_calceolata.AAC.3